MALTVGFEGDHFEGGNGRGPGPKGARVAANASGEVEGDPHADRLPSRQNMTAFTLERTSHFTGREFTSFLYAEDRDPIAGKVGRRRPATRPVA